MKEKLTTKQHTSDAAIQFNNHHHAYQNFHSEYEHSNQPTPTQ